MGIKLTIYDIIKKPLVTEKTTNLIQNHNQYVFYVHPKANKIQVREAIEKIFKVKVERVNVIKLKGKLRRRGLTSGRTPDKKKVVVKLKKGNKINIFEGA